MNHLSLDQIEHRTPEVEYRRCRSRPHNPGRRRAIPSRRLDLVHSAAVMTSLNAPPGFERTLIREATLADLDLDAIAAFANQRAPALAAHMDPPQLARQFGLAGPAGRDLVPTAAGLYVFGRWPQAMRPQWGVAAIRVDGRVLADPLTASESLDGPVPALVQAVIAFVAEHTYSVADQVDRTTTHEYPAAALREALTNALVHRDLRLPARVSVTAFNDRLEIWSPGPANAKLELDSVAQLGGMSIARNPIVAAMARGLELIDQIGRGLPTIRRSCQRDGGGDPIFDTDDYGVLVTLPSSLAKPRGRQSLRRQ